MMTRSTREASDQQELETSLGELPEGTTVGPTQNRPKITLRLPGNNKRQVSLSSMDADASIPKRPRLLAADALSPLSEVEVLDVTEHKGSTERKADRLIDIEAVSPKTFTRSPGGALENLMREQRAMMCGNAGLITPMATIPEIRYTLINWQIRGRFVMIRLASSEGGGAWYRGDQLPVSIRAQWRSQLEAKPEEARLFKQLSNHREGTGKIDRHIGIHVYGTKCDDCCELKFLLKHEDARFGTPYDVESGQTLLDEWKPHIAQWWKRRIAVHRQEGRLALITQIASGTPQALLKCADYIIDVEDMHVSPEDDESLGTSSL